MVSKNQSFQKYLEFFNYKDYEEDIQVLINKLISWYSVKFSNSYLESLLNEKKDIDKTLFEMMNLEALLNHCTTFELELLQMSLSKEKVQLQKNLIISAGWGLIYHKDTSPKYGFYRATQLLKDFNSLFRWNLNPNIYKEVLNRDYSLDNPEVIQLLHQKKKEKQESKNQKRVIKRFPFRKLRKKRS